MLLRQLWTAPLLPQRMGQLGPLGRPRSRCNRLLATLLPLQVSPHSLSSPLPNSHRAQHLLTPHHSCLTARRRRKAGRQPFYGTGWAARPMPGNNNTAAPYHNNNQNYSQQQPAPPYSPSQANSNTGYYGGAGQNQSYYNNGQQNGVEMQPPQPTYGGAQYMPPPGPPPGKVA
jgi:hypothetical protein